MTQLEELKAVFDRPQITLAAAARYLHKDPRTLLSNPKFPVKKCGGRYMISIVSLARWLET